ncbi:predicted protein [Histoplasma capsulatum H143]|uniref:Uncharacterized protein n=1 Tax=Ajellomyces capsulatus (strain H143) TaxID=544712 RepID=C6H295_AJECH|nr:predicted protein [Histoplasma capsulatum H143]
MTSALAATPDVCSGVGGYKSFSLPPIKGWELPTSKTSRRNYLDHHGFFLPPSLTQMAPALSLPSALKSTLRECFWSLIPGAVITHPSSSSWGPGVSVCLNMTKATPTDTMGPYTESFRGYVVSSSSLRDNVLGGKMGENWDTYRG